ncbi:FAD-binding protein [Bifidobacterium choloepi]|uniref:UDP-N-acetylenolpyruvoylglucosamine reductase n=1 Tax=Bifidobacterium choloepi TaxID=2614131 RepID=A0A6I5NE87_9BIFI|nr:FAD-binding protein [Bifidobacterium choloepi]
MGVGGAIRTFVEPMSRVAVIEAVEDADSRGLPLCVVGGGSNILASSDAFDGVVVRDARRNITVPDEAAPVEGGDRTVHVSAEAGANWDDFVAFTVGIGLAGVEGLSGIPGTVGASVVQNIGAYGQEVASAVESVEVWDREAKKTMELAAADLKFGYRSSLLKSTMYSAPGVPADRFFPTPRYVVLSVTFALQHAVTGTVGYAQLAKALGVELGAAMPIARIRSAVLKVRAAKGMLEDATRYLNPAMQSTKRQANIDEAIREQEAHRLEDDGRQASDDPSAARIADGIALGEGYVTDWNRHSCGSFFMNPILSAGDAARLPDDAPRFDATLPDGTAGVKTSAAWLIDHAGFHKGYKVAPDARASLSTLHTLALTNRGGATSADLLALARAVRDGVRAKFGVTLVPEPVFVGLSLD